MMKHGMTLFQLSYDIVANIAGARTRNPHVNVVPAAFVANLQNDVTTKSKKRFFLSYNLTSSVRLARIEPAPSAKRPTL
jgi:hypothetical protein